MKPRFSEAPIITRINELEQRLEKAEVADEGARW